MMKGSFDRDPGHAQDSVKTAFRLNKSSFDRDPGHALDSVKTAVFRKKVVLIVIRTTP
jgi:hypothetical protein